MLKKFCDVCGKELAGIKFNQTWQFELKSSENNERVSYDEEVNEMCEDCATKVHCAISGIKNGVDIVDSAKLNTKIK